MELKYSGTQTKLPGKKSGNETEGMHTEEIKDVDTANLELSIKEHIREEILQGNYKMNIAPSDLVDFGGQKSYDMTHQLFIQCKGTFVLMFDGRYGLYDALEEYKPNEITTICTYRFNYNTSIAIFLAHCFEGNFAITLQPSSVVFVIRCTMSCFCQTVYDVLRKSSLLKVLECSFIKQFM